MESQPLPDRLMNQSGLGGHDCTSDALATFNATERLHMPSGLENPSTAGHPADVMLPAVRRVSPPQASAKVTPFTGCLRDGAPMVSLTCSLWGLFGTKCAGSTIGKDVAYRCVCKDCPANDILYCHVLPSPEGLATTSWFCPPNTSTENSSLQLWRVINVGLYQH